MHEHVFYSFKSIVFDTKDAAPLLRAMDWRLGPFKEVYWGTFNSEEIAKKKLEICGLAKEAGFKIVLSNVRKIEQIP
ncbi:MAG: hypothetical protein UW20_C0005G0052 [Candidatus Woesebacteria bacterium GW2011_GWB1_44_11]|uniref:Uncharacterized protein n=2 Tax=Candidatus Woeseibacteriota TaxID=1752722 RepID=A0A1F8DHJ5_9BACT|nr:MAG: hypothetical protein UW20_C0005G0052 [Candidatus Woesebacteria bacterium GW2011_GWB1_44_11]OGM88074.1 MAG: hypothetical protein A2573_01040 [Candidatus Woesebacteria bacterium RIFOXYD1_FULL_43_18]